MVSILFGCNMQLEQLSPMYMNPLCHSGDSGQCTRMSMASLKLVISVMGTWREEVGGTGDGQLNLDRVQWSCNKELHENDSRRSEHKVTTHCGGTTTLKTERADCLFWQSCLSSKNQTWYFGGAQRMSNRLPGTLEVPIERPVAGELI